MYAVSITRQAQHQLTALSPADRRRVMAAIHALANTPRPPVCIKLTGSELWRIRVSVYRVIYEIDDGAQLVIVIRVAHRREAYR